MPAPQLEVAPCTSPTAGLITHAGLVEGKPAFRIPNLVIRTLHWDGLAMMFRQQAGAVVDTLVLERAVSRKQ